MLFLFLREIFREFIKQHASKPMIIRRFIEESAVTLDQLYHFLLVFGILSYDLRHNLLLHHRVLLLL